MLTSTTNEQKTQTPLYLKHPNFKHYDPDKPTRIAVYVWVSDKNQIDSIWGCGHGDFVKCLDTNELWMCDRSNSSRYKPVCESESPMFFTSKKGCRFVLLSHRRWCPIVLEPFEQVTWKEKVGLIQRLKDPNQESKPNQHDNSNHNKPNNITNDLFEPRLLNLILQFMYLEIIPETYWQPIMMVLDRVSDRNQYVSFDTRPYRPQIETSQLFLLTWHDECMLMGMELELCDKSWLYILDPDPVELSWRKDHECCLQHRWKMLKHYLGHCSSPMVFKLDDKAMGFNQDTVNTWRKKGVVKNNRWRPLHILFLHRNVHFFRQFEPDKIQCRHHMFDHLNVDISHCSGAPIVSTLAKNL